MFSPGQTYRRWHRKINTTEKRHACASAIAASAIPALVAAHGHVIDDVPELPIIVDGKYEAINTTKQAIQLLNSVGLQKELQKVVNSQRTRSTRGKMRGRRKMLKKGPLVVYAKDEGIAQAVRNLPGVDSVCIDSLSVLKLAPGGRFGRLVVWTQPAFEQLGKMFGSYDQPAEMKKGYTLQRPFMANSDVGRIINTDEVQLALNPAKAPIVHNTARRNPLRSYRHLRQIIPGLPRKKKNSGLTKKN